MSVIHNFDLNITFDEGSFSQNNRREDILPIIDLNASPNTETSQDEHDDEVGGFNHVNLNEFPASDGEDNDSVLESEASKKLIMLTNTQRHAVYLSLLEASNNGKLKKDTTRNIAGKYSVSTSTIRRIWRRSKENTYGEEISVSHRKTKNCGRKRIQIDVEQFQNIPLAKRTTLYSAACAMNVSKSTLGRWKKLGNIRRHSNAIKPLLKDENKKARLRFCVKMLDEDTLPYDPKFLSMYNLIHIDEKWFYMTKKSEKYYLVPEEEGPLRTCKSKSFICKVMFLAAVARPRFDEQRNETFSGKIGIFPFVTKEPAKRKSVNRAAGTMETKVMNSVGKDIIRSFFIEKILPAIRSKWPSSESHMPIYIQQDNAWTHIDPNDEEFCKAAKISGFDIRLTCQPPNSPDFNVLDLGFFRAIQSLQYKESTKIVDELISAVEKAYEDFSTIKSNRIFLSLQLCMRESMKINGSNNYKISHMNKANLEREGRLPCQISCDPELIQAVLAELESG